MNRLWIGSFLLITLSVVAAPITAVDTATFTVTESCSYANKIKVLHSNENLPKLIIGSTYHALAYNTDKKQHVWIEVPGEGKQWTYSRCGTAKNINKINKTSEKNVAGQFTFYRLSLSYTPEYCGSLGDASSSDSYKEQCSIESQWILHGWWPQNVGTTHYDHCVEGAGEADAIDINHIKTFTPSDYLIKHEWEAHGVCSTLSRSKYYAMAEKIWSSIKRPHLKVGTYKADQIVSLFVNANPQLPITSKMIELACTANPHNKYADNTSLDEIRICYSKKGKLIECPDYKIGCNENHIMVRW